MAKKFDFIQLKKAEEQRIKETASNIELIILDEFKTFIPPLSTEEYEGLENSILSEGCRESLILWKNGSDTILIDGHNRYEICQKHQIAFSTKFLDFGSKEEAKLWMLTNQLGRRNLSKEQASYLRGKKYHAEKMLSGTRTDLMQNLHKVDNTKDKLSKEYGISARTIMNDALFAKAIDKIGEVNSELKREILSGKAKVNKSQIQELAKIETLPVLEKVEDLASLFQTEKIEVSDQLKTKKEHLLKFIKKTDFDLMSLEQIEKFCLDLAPKK